MKLVGLHLTDEGKELILELAKIINNNRLSTNNNNKKKRFSFKNRYKSQIIIS